MIRKLTFLFFLFSTFFYSQQTEEELKNILFDVEFCTAGPKEIREIDSIVTICRKYSYHDGIALGYLKTANIYNKNNEVKKAFYYIDKVDKENLINEESDFEIVLHQHIIKSLLYFNLGERVTAFGLLDEIYEETIRQNNAYYTYVINWQYAGFYNEMNQREKALEKIKIAYKYSKIYRENKNHRYKIHKAHLSWSFMTTSYMAAIYIDMGRHDLAKGYIQESLNDLKKNDNKSLLYFNLFNAAKYYRAVKDFKSARHYLWMCKKIAGHHFKDEFHQKSVAKELKSLYEEMKEKDSTAYYVNQLLDIQTAKEKQNQVLKDIIDKKDQTDEKNEKKLTQGLFFILLVSAVICILFIFLFLRYYKKHKSKGQDKIDIPHKLPVQECIFKEVIRLAKENSPEFLTRFHEYCPHFSEELLKVSVLKISEVRFCAYIYLNFSTKDIAEYTHTSVRTVQTKKYNLRKKLNIPGDMDIYVWFSKLLK
jgi:DNA-binding CsgD family transcriptional regulator